MELAFAGSFAWAAWQVLGKLYKYAAKIEKNIDDGRLLGDWERECKAQAANKLRGSASMGRGAAASGHDHIFEEWRAKKLKPPQAAQLISDLAELAQWAGAGSWVPELRGDAPPKPWTEYGPAGKVHLLQAADSLDFNFADVVKRQAEDLAGNWLWQVTEALPPLSAEPTRSAGPSARLGDLKTRLAEAEAAVRKAFDCERRSQAAALKGLVQPLAVAGCMRKIQTLKVLLDEAGLTSAASAAAAERLRAELKTPITLAAAEEGVAAQKAAAAAAVEAEAAAAVEAERTARMAEIEMAAAATYRRVLTLQAASPSHWHASSSTPALHRLGLLAALLGELAGCSDATAAGPAAVTGGAAAAAVELADAVRKLTPQMRVKLSDEEKARQTELLAALTPAPEPMPAPEQPAAAETEEKQAAAEAAAPAEEEEAPIASPRPSTGAAAAALRDLLEAAIRGQLANARAERKAARAAAREAAANEAAAAKAAAAAKEAEAAAAAAVADVKDEAETPTEESAEGAAAAAAGEKAGEEEREDAAEASKPEEGEAAAEAEEKTPEGEAPAAAEDLEPAAVEAAGGEKKEKAEELAKSSSAAAGEELAAEPEAAVEVDEEEEPPTPEELVDVEAVQKAVEAEARARADAEKEGAVLKLQDALEALRATTEAAVLKALVAKVAYADAAAAADTRAALSTGGAADNAAAADAPDAGSRLLALESLARGAAAATSTELALAAAVADAAAKLTAADRAVLDAASAAAVGRVEAAAARVKLTADVAKLEMGPGCADVLRRADGWLAEQQEAEAASAARAAERAAMAAARAEARAAKAAAEEEKAADTAAKAEAVEEEKAEAAAEGDAAAEEERKTEAVEKAQEEPMAAADEEEEEEAEEEEVGPAVEPARLTEGRKLVLELLAEGLVLLELPGPSNRKLQLLRESVDALAPVDGDGAVQQRLLTTLKEVVGQLGPIGGSVDARVSQVADEAEREKLLQVRSDATAIYLALTAFLRLESDTWEAAKGDLEQAKKAVYGMKIERRAESLAAGRGACGLVSERCAALARGVLGLGTAQGKEAAVPAKEALQATAEQAQMLSTALNDYLSYVRLREHALGVPITARAELDEECELSLPTLEEMTSRHGEEALWLDISGVGLPPPTEEDEQEAEQGEKEEADGEEEQEEQEEEGGSTPAPSAKRGAHERALAELQRRLDEWHTAGLRLLSRGQAALVTLGGLTLPDGSGELRLVSDLGLPSAKSLLQLGAEKVARLQLLAAEAVSGANAGVESPLQWYLLVPSESVAPLTAFLRDNDYFGLLPTQVHVYANEVRPPLMNEDFKVVLDSTGCRTARSQPGSGEVFLALRRCGALAHMRRMGVRCLEVQAVEDNLLARPLDPAFVGACAATAIDAAAKVAVPGVQTDGTSALPELYSRYLELLGADSPLLPYLGDAVPATGSYFFSMDFVRRVEKLLREQPMALYRLAPADKVPTRGAARTGAAAPAAAPGGGAVGYRLERRLSDFASPAVGRLLGGPPVHLAMVAVDAGTEFAPVWGAAPFYRTATPRAAVDALLLQTTRWVEDGGGVVADEEEGVVEVSPLVSYAGEGLAPLVEGKTFEEAYVLELQGFSAKSSGTASNVGLWAVPALLLYGGVAATKLLVRK